MLLFTRLILIAFVFITNPLSAKDNTPKVAPDFIIEDNTRLSDLKGKIVYLDFWASWCGPCRKSFPWLNKIYKQHNSQDFAMLSINLDTERHLADKFLKKYPADFSITYDPMGDLAREYEVTGMPSSYLIDHNGNIVATHVGFREKRISGYEQQIEHLLKLKTSEKTKR
jgi:thiol-disulfide isomerase/thioredoxin